MPTKRNGIRPMAEPVAAAGARAYARARVPAPGGRVGRTLLVNLSLIGIAAIALLFAVLGTTIASSFERLEQRELDGHLSRAADFQQRTLRTLDAKSKDWAVWDDTYRFGQDFNRHYVEANINAESFRNAIVDGMAVYRYADGAVRSYSFDRESGAARAPVAAGLAKIVSSPAFVSRVRAQNGAQGFVTIDGKLFALAANQLRRSEGQGVPVGFQLFIQQLTSVRAAQALQVDARVEPASAVTGTRIAKSGGAIAVTLPLQGIGAGPPGALELRLPRPLMEAMRQLLALTFVGVVLLVSAMLLFLRRRIKTLVLDPVERLHSHVESIRASGKLRALDEAMPANEFGALRDEFNRMTGELQTLRAELESHSFALGKNQSAVGLMHNLRNCLSPARVILENLETDGGVALPAQAAQALRELASDGVPAERRAKLAAFLEAAHSRLDDRAARQRQSVREAARSLAGGLAAIDSAGGERANIRFDEQCDLAALLGHSGNVARYAEGDTIKVAIDCEQRLAVRGNRVLLSQVLENLVANAVEAIRETGRADGVILLRAAAGSKVCRVTVSDNGGGFAAEAAERLFERGYSTRTSKSGGMGLHWCANTVRAMGGELTLDSPGPGHGARATLQLALWQDAAPAIADAA